MSVPTFPDRTTRRQALGARRPVRIGHGRIRILPTRQGWGFALLVVALLVASVNYANNPGYLFTFLLAAVALNAAFLCWRNLLGLRVELLPSAPVFAGQVAILRLRLGDGPRAGIQLQIGDRARVVDFDASIIEVPLELPSRRRGWLWPGALLLATRHPLGLFQAWSLLRIDEPILVYPRPAPALPGSRLPTPDTGTQRPGDEEWQGLRAFRPGDPLSRLDWKSLARERGLMSKQFHDPDEARPQRIDWDDYAPADTEHRLRQLTRAVLEAAAGDRPWELRLPGTRLGPDRGARHRARCLEALALHGMPERPS